MTLHSECQIHPAMKNHIQSVTATLALATALHMSGCKPKGAEEDPKVATEVAVQVAKVTRTTLRTHVEAYGTVEAEPASATKPAAAAKITAAVAGVIAQANAVEGERVKKGAILFQLDDRVAQAASERAKQGVAKAQAAEKFARQVLQREQTLIKQEGTSLKKLEEAQQQLVTSTLEVRAAEAELAAAETQRKLLQVEAPLDGTLLRVNARVGESIDPTATLAEIVDTARLIIVAKVPTGEMNRLKSGQSAEVFTSSGDHVVATGSVSYISPQVDGNTDSIAIWVSLPKEAGMRRGQFARVRVTTESRSERLAVPIESIYKDYDGAVTLSVVEGNIAKQKVVKAGLRDGKLVEVEGDGLVEGATVVTTGSYALPKETKIRVLNAAKEEAK